MNPYTVYVRYYVRIRNGRPEYVRQHHRRPWGTVGTRRRIWLSRRRGAVSWKVTFRRPS
jgi:hypothetical protein